MMIAEWNSEEKVNGGKDLYWYGWDFVQFFCTRDNRQFTIHVSIPISFCSTLIYKATWIKSSSKVY